MIRIHCCRKIVADQKGMALVSALLLLLIVTTLAIGLSTDTSIDVRIAAYQRFKARAYGFGEAGMMTATEVLEDNIYEAGWDDLPAPIGYPNLSGDYNGAITILDDGVFYMDNNDNNPPENRIIMTGDIRSDIATQLVVAKFSEGGAIQLAAGYAGMAKSVSAGGGHVIYNFISEGTDSDQARASLGLHYRHVVK